MPTHDCSKCEAAGTCPLESIAPWLNDHEEEIQGAANDQAESLARACATFEMIVSMGKPDHKDILHVVIAAFSLGYHKGRQFTPVPKVFEEM